MDVATPKITPFTLNLEDEDIPFVGLMGTCPMLGDVDVLIGTILDNINYWGGMHLTPSLPLWRSSPSSIVHGSRACELDCVNITNESTSSGSKKVTWCFALQACASCRTLVEPTSHTFQKNPKQDLILDMWPHLWSFILLPIFSLPY